MRQDRTTYPKINSLWKRQGWYLDEGKKNNPEYQAGRQSFIVGDYAIPEFANIKKWLVQEKIDGTNIRIHFQDKVEFYGRSDDATMPPSLYKYLVQEFTPEKLSSVFKEDVSFPGIWLFGEGYGAKIQKGGGNYRKDQAFILFDVKVGNWWLTQDAVKEIAHQLNIPYAPIIGIITEDEIVSYVKSHPFSLCSEDEQVMEGIIARPEPMMLLRNGEPLMMKLKCKEFPK